MPPTSALMRLGQQQQRQQQQLLEEMARRQQQQQAQRIKDLQGTWAQGGGMTAAGNAASGVHGAQGAGVDPRSTSAAAAAPSGGSTVASLGGGASAGASAGMGSGNSGAQAASQWIAAQQRMQAMAYHPQQGWQQSALAAQRGMQQMHGAMAGMAPNDAAQYESQLRAYYQFIAQQQQQAQQHQHGGQDAAAYAQQGGYHPYQQNFSYGMPYSRGEHI